MIIRMCPQLTLKASPLNSRGSARPADRTTRVTIRTLSVGRADPRLLRDNPFRIIRACDALLAKNFFKFFPKILLSLGIISYLCGGSTKGKTVMLGIDSKETPVVTGIYAEEVRDALRRVHLGLPNEADQKIAARSANIKREYEAVWR